MIKLSMVITLMAVAMITWVGWVWPEMTTMIMKGIFETKKTLELQNTQRLDHLISSCLYL